MRDIRDALVALTQSAGEVGDSLTFGCDCEGCTKTATGLADAILAEFDVTPRDEDQWWESLVEVACDKGHRIFIDDGDGGVYACPACALLPTALPSVEDVARALFDAEYHDIDATERSIEWSVVNGTDHARKHGTAWHRQARAVLALLPGRTEAEVKAEALREAQDELVRRDAFTERSLRVLDELIEKGEDSQ